MADRTQDLSTRWVISLGVTLVALLAAVGWLDVARGRQLFILATNQEWVMRELERLRDRMDRVERNQWPNQ